jgi:predicted 3-demethylubiquinone-9 3-methyltransferase (glyoxalase superfamily)
MTPQRITPWLWSDNQTEAAARFYTGIFKNSKVTYAGQPTLTTQGEN